MFVSLSIYLSPYYAMEWTWGGAEDDHEQRNSYITSGSSITILRLRMFTGRLLTLMFVLPSIILG